MIGKLAREYLSAFGKFSPDARRFLGVSLSFQLGAQILAFLLTLYLKRLGFDEAAIGKVLSAQRLGAALVALPASLLVARRGSPGLIAASFGLCALAAGIQALSTGAESIQAASFLFGCASTIVVIFSGPYLLRNSGPDERVHLFSVNGALVWAASTLGNGAGYLKDALVGFLGLDETLSYRLAMSVGIAFMLGALALALRLGRGSMGALPERSHGGIPTGEALRPELPSRPAPSEPAIPEPAPRGGLAALFAKLLLPGFLIGIGAGLTIPYINLYFKAEFGLSDSAIGTIMAGGQICTLAGIAIGPALARRKGKAWVILGSQGLSIPFIVALTWANFLPFVAVAYMARQALMNMNGPIADAFALEKVPMNRQHLLNALKTFLWTSSWAIAVLVSGYVIRSHGYPASFTATALLYLAATALFAAFWRRELRPGRRRAA